MGSTLSSRERVEDATREAHVRVIIEALNEFLREPHEPASRRGLVRVLDKYREADGRLFPHASFTGVSRHGSAPLLPPGEMEAARALVKHSTKKPKTAPVGLPWD